VQMEPPVGLLAEQLVELLVEQQAVGQSHCSFEISDQQQWHCHGEVSSERSESMRREPGSLTSSSSSSSLIVGWCSVGCEGGGGKVTASGFTDPTRFGGGFELAGGCVTAALTATGGATTGATFWMGGGGAESSPSDQPSSESFPLSTFVSFV
jgi:hypothetical protein